MKTAQNIALTTKGLTVGYGTILKPQIILSELNLIAKQGELVCLMGQNGMGKSTLLRTISGVQQPLGGEVFIGDDLLSELSLQTVSEKISLVLTHKPTAGNLSVVELITMGRYPYLGWNMKLSPDDKVLIDSAVEQINLTELLHKKIYTLSDGQLQKVMIARALVQDGKLLLLDEPTAHLDLNNRVEIMYLLRNLAITMKKVVVMATHELDLALQMADKLWLVDNNGKVQEGVPEDLVLNGSLDAVFGHKGYNLKTGRIEHETKGASIKLEGNGYGYLWTKNALERNGYQISALAEVEIEIIHTDSVFKWKIHGQSGEEKMVSSLEEMLNVL